MIAGIILEAPSDFGWGFCFFAAFSLKCLPSNSACGSLYELFIAEQVVSAAGCHYFGLPGEEAVKVRQVGSVD